jgi:hypothetical protein
MSDIDQLVAELRWEATCDSSGQFSMTSSAALEKLARFQLQDPRRYVLAAVAAGCAAGAEQIVVTEHPDSCKIELVGWLDLTLDRLRELFASLFSADPKLTPLRYLARAVLGAAGLDPYYISLHLTEQSGRSAGSLRLTGNRFRSVSSWGRGYPGVCLYVQEKANAGVFQRLFGGLLGAQSPTLEMLRAYCGFCAVPILANGESVACAPRLGECTRVWKIGAVKGDWRGHPEESSLEAGGDFRALVGWSPWAAWGCPSTVVVHGVQYPIAAESFGTPHGRGVIWCDAARLDLSLENVVEDDAWRARLSYLKELYATGR